MPVFTGHADTSGARVLRAKGKTLQGECLKCGKCCADVRPNCTHLKPEVWDGIKVEICEDYQNRPWYCAFFPHDPNYVMPDGCGFYWE